MSIYNSFADRLILWMVIMQEKQKEELQLTVYVTVQTCVHVCQIYSQEAGQWRWMYRQRNVFILGVFR